jgi:hypothetical protein
MIIISYIILGSVVGVLAGLLGIGGGLIIVPVLTFMFTSQGIPYEHVLHLALGTSLASIVFTSFSSIRSHHKRGAVIWPVVLKITPGIIIGTFSGAWAASHLSTNFLKIFFTIFLLYVGIQMLLGIKPKPTREIPGTAGISLAGTVIGIVSSLVGIGGGTLSVTFLNWCNVTMHRAIGTSAAIGFPIAVTGALGYALNGSFIEGLPADSYGYIHLTALGGIAAASILTAPIGAKLAHSLPVDKLKKIFASLLLLLAVRMAWSLF